MIALTFSPTGGHIYPTIALAEQFNKNACYLLTPDHPVALNILKKYDFKYFALRAKSKKVLSQLTRFWKARKILKTNHTEALVSAGGYFTFPVILAAKSLGLPVFFLEQNVLPGQANRRLAFLATKIYTAFAESLKYFPKNKTLVIGNPVRNYFAKDELFEEFKKEKLAKNPTILVFGGSQGAEFINRLILDNQEKILQKKLNILLLTGPNFFKAQFPDLTYKKIAPKDNSVQILVLPFFEKMDYLYNLADAVVARAGATTIAELIEFKKKALLIPYPFAKENHQALNAQVFVQNQFGLSLDQKELNWDSLLANINQLLKMPFPKQTAMPQNAAKEIAKDINLFIKKL